MKKISLFLVFGMLLGMSVLTAGEQNMKLSAGIGFPNMVNAQATYFVEKDVEVGGLFGLFAMPIGKQACGADVRLGAYSVEAVAKKYFGSRDGAFAAIRLGYRDFYVNTVQLTGTPYDINVGVKSIYLGAGIGTNFLIAQSFSLSAELGIQYPFSNSDYEVQNSGTGTLDPSVRTGPLKEGMDRMKGVLPYLMLTGSLSF